MRLKEASMGALPRDKIVGGDDEMLALLSALGRLTEPGSQWGLTLALLGTWWSHGLGIATARHLQLRSQTHRQGSKLMENVSDS
jgi:hypothetical protein